MKQPQENDEGIITQDDLKEKEMDDPRVQAMKQYLNDLVIKTYLFSLSVKIITNYRNELSELMEISIIFSNITFSGMFKISIKTKQAQTWTLISLIT